MRTFPFSAVVGSDDMALALVLTSISPEVGGVLVRGEKGTAKSTMVRALAAVQPDQLVVQGCRFSCDPADPDPACPDGPHADVVAVRRPARLVELPVGATEDRVIGSLDLQQALGSGRVSYEPGLLAAAHRGILYVDEVNLLHDHLVDLLLDAAAMGRSTVERDGVSVAHAARLVLVGTMNPEEGELRPQLLDRFGLTVEVAAPRDPALRSEVVRRRLAYDADPAALVARFADQEATLRVRLAAAQERLDRVQLSDWALTKIAAVCAGFEVDGMRADIVTARASVAHAAWHDRTDVTRADIRAAARLALPHRRRRNPFDAPGLDEELLDRLLGDDDLEPEPEPESPTTDPEGPTPDDTDGPATPPDGGEQTRTDTGTADPAESADGSDQPVEQPGQPAPVSIASAGQPYRARLLTVRGTGDGEAGRRSRALTSVGRTVGATPTTGSRLHFPATVRAAAIEQQRRGRQAGDRLLFARGDLRTAVTEGRESNLVLFCVDASGSMAARKRMAEVKTAVLSLLLDAYQRRDKVGLVTFRGAGATLALPPTSSVEVAARRLEEVPSGGRTPLAEGLLCAADTLRWERIRDPRRRALLVVITDGRATAGADALVRSRQAATYVSGLGIDAVVVDCESGRMSLGLARGLAEDLQAQYVQLAEVNAEALAGVAGASRRSAA
ncbi:MAG TPA: magnesium chelatase subunit D family protein [Microlunatus sp.]|nr:magnesium chelatase subunit D family protein [Microlunatus sp.]